MTEWADMQLEQAKTCCISILGILEEVRAVIIHQRA